MKKEDKGLLIEQFAELLGQYPHFYLVDLADLDSTTTSDLRRECFKSQIKLLMVKNTLFEKALEKKEGDFEVLTQVLKGTTGVMFCETANVPAKLIKDFGKKHDGKPALKAAYAEESIYVGADQLEALCAIKSKNELIAEVVAALESPIKGVISALDGGTVLHGLLDAIEEKKAE